MSLAAGLGTRFRPHTEILPKPCLPFLNLPMGLFGLGLFEQSQDLRVLMNTHHLGEKVSAVFGNYADSFNELRFINEEGVILGSGGGLKNAETFFINESSFVLMNSDEVFFPQERHFLREAFQEHVKSEAVATLLVMDHPGVGRELSGVWCENQNVFNFGKKPCLENLKGWHYLGYLILSSKIFPYLEEKENFNILHDGIAKILDQERADSLVKIYPVKGLWYETGNFEDYMEAVENVLILLLLDKLFLSKNQEICLSEVRQMHPWFDVQKLFEGSLEIQGSGEIKSAVLYLKEILDKFSPGWVLKICETGILFCHSTTLLERNVEVRKWAVLGPGIRVTEGTVLEQAVLYPHPEFREGGVCGSFKNKFEFII